MHLYKNGDFPELIIDIRPGEPELGLWCPNCLLPSAYTVPIYSGDTQIGHVRRCDECEPEDLDET